MTLESFWLTTIGISSVVTALSNKAAKDTIKRHGYTVDYSNTTMFERLNYFLTDYFFLCIPVYNLWRSIVTNRIKKKPSVYADERFETYKDRGVLKEISYEEPVKEETEVFRREKPTEELTNVVRKVKKVEKKKDQLPPRFEEASKPKKIEQPYYYGNTDELSYLKAIQQRKIDEYQLMEESCLLPYSERKAMYDDIMERHRRIKELENKARREAEIERLKQEREQLINQNEKKLELK